MNRQDILKKLQSGNAEYLRAAEPIPSLRKNTAKHGQHPYAVVVCCSDSRVIPEQIFGASIGDLFVIRVAGNVLDRQQLGSIEYAVEHLHTKTVAVLGHTGCGAVHAALNGGGEGYVRSITDAIRRAIGEECNEEKACCLNACYAAETIRQAFCDHADFADADILAAVYDIGSGTVRWLSDCQS